MSSNLTTPGVLRVSASDPLDAFNGAQLRTIFPYSRYLGNQYFAGTGMEIAVLDQADEERLCTVLEKQSDLEYPLPPHRIQFDVQLRTKFANKLLMLQSSYFSSCGGKTARTPTLCWQFRDSVVLFNWPDNVANTYNYHEGNYFAGYENCTILNHDELSDESQFNTLYEQVQYRQQDQTNGSLLYAKFETTQHPCTVPFSKVSTQFFFSVLPALLLLFMAQVALSVLILNRERWGKKQKEHGHKLWALYVLVITLAVMSYLASIDGYGTQGTLGVLSSNFQRAGFSLSRIGINLAISVVWLDVSQLVALGTRDSNLKKILKRGFYLFIYAEILATVLLLHPFASMSVVYIVPAILLVSESIVGSCFIVSALIMLRKLGGATDEVLSREVKHKTVRRVSVFVLLSGCTSLINIGFFLFLTLNLSTVLNSPSQYLVVFGVLQYCRIIDAALQILVLKPEKDSAFLGLRVLAKWISLILCCLPLCCLSCLFQAPKAQMTKINSAESVENGKPNLALEQPTDTKEIDELNK